MQLIPSLNGLRAIAVSMVIGSHLTRSSPEYLSVPLMFFDGALGVRIFFCISGFLITLLLLREKERDQFVNLKNFYARRVIRIFPVCYLFVFSLFVLTQSTGLTLSSCQYLTAVTYTKNYACGSWVDGHLWSLAVEEQFYLLWPLAIAIAPSRIGVLIAILGIAVAAPSRASEYLLGHRTFTWLASSTDALMIGALAAIFAHGSHNRFLGILRFKPRPMRVLAIGAMAAPIVLSRHMLLGWFTVTLGPTLEALCATYLICSYAYLRRGAGFWLLNTKFASYLGVISYSLYIWQQPFFDKPEAYGLESAALLTFPFNLIAVFTVGVLSYHCFEKPLLGLRQRFRRQTRSPVTLASSPSVSRPTPLVESRLGA